MPTIRTNWNGADDIEGMLYGKFLGANDYYFPSTFSEGALGRATYGANQPIDQKKVAGLVRAIKNNEDIAPIAGFKNADGLIDIYDGHHRLAAYQKAGKMPRVKLFTRETKDQAYNYADEWAKNAVKEVKQYLPAKPKAGLDEYGMGTIDLSDLNTPKIQYSLDDSGITLYHGTPNKFEDFDDTLPSVWFSDSDKNLRDTGLSIKGGQSMNIMERQLPKDLKIADEELADRLTKQQLQDRGYAGIAYTERGPNGDETYYEIFNPNKSLKKVGGVQKESLTEMSKKINAMNASRGNMADGVKRIGSAEVAPVAPETLPTGYETIKKYLETNPNTEIERIVGAKVDDFDVFPAKLKEWIEGEGYDASANVVDNLNIARRILAEQTLDEMNMAGASGYRKFLETRSRLQADNPHMGLGPRSYTISANDDQIYQTDAAKLDREYSDRLGIGRSHTPMSDKVLSSDAQGYYMGGGIGINPLYASGESGVSTIGHERMHAWQDINKGEWDSRVVDAIDELRAELKNHYHTKSQIKEYRKSGADLDYYADNKEQEARMLQSYLDNEGFTNTYRKNSERGTEWGDEIKPAFDRFFKKLRALSKKGVALPAIAGLVGIGALAGKKDDKSVDNIE